MYWQPRLTPPVQCMQCSRHLCMSPIKTARSLACPCLPAAMSNVLPSQQWNTLFSTSHQRWKFHYPVDGYQLTITENCCSCQLPVSVWRNSGGFIAESAYHINVACDRLMSCAGMANAKCPISWNKLSPQHNMEDIKKGLQLDLSTWAVYTVLKLKKAPQMGRKKSFCFEVNLQEVVFCVCSCEAQSSRSASLMLLCWWLKSITSGLFLTEIKTRSMPICAANPISSSSDGMA